MSQSLKKGVMLVGIVAIGFATFGIGSLVLSSGLSLGAALGAGIAGTATTWGAMLAFGVTAYSIGTAPKSPSIDSTGANKRGTPYADPNAMGAFVFGTTTVPRELVAEYTSRHDRRQGCTRPRSETTAAAAAAASSAVEAEVTE
jgi:hypothetical protein